ncbi:MAG: autotransporter-associated beta strand repeat-containing protein [Akkermansiaceae bacterium]|nr:autotransporter-associated beta strand repeat-containing protein [Akkermansiaceae bacterium]
MIKQLIIGQIVSGAVFLTAFAEDSTGILRKPIPDKLIVLTFDDGCASGYTVVAPILKPLGFNASFYVCDFDSFKTRKDWYMTWRQMIELDRRGFEIGNHTVGHGGGMDNYLAMEDEVFANNGPKMTTVCWPLYGVGWNICPDLAKRGYTFGRGGHERPYRPTVDHPFDVPSFTITDSQPIEAFVKKAQQACQGRVVVYCFHGVPDMEHGPVGVEPATFKVMMQYLKDNNYKCIAMRDLAEYIDPAKAAKLTPPQDVKAEEPFLTNKDDKPCGVVVKAVKPNPEPEKKPEPAKASLTKAPAVKALSSDKPNVFTWSKAEAGNWSDGSKWTNNLSNGSAPVAAGQPDYVLNFNQAGKYTVTHDLSEGFELNQLNLGVGQGNAMILAGKGIKFTGTQASINQNSIFTEDRINVPINLSSDVTVNSFGFNYSRPAARLIIGGLISGTGGLIVNDGGPLHIINSANTYSGGTIINGGTLAMDGWSNGKPGTLGTGPVTLNDGATLQPCGGVCTNPLILNGGTIEGNFTWNGPITLNGIAEIAGYNLNLNNISGGISGPGGLTEIGIQGAFGRNNFGTVYLWGVNTYTGPTTVRMAKLFLKKAAALYNADTAQWAPAKISVHPGATLVLSAGGPGEFTGEQVGTLLRNLTAAVNGNGLMAGSILCLDTANAKETVTVAANITDSKGPGGGAFLIRKCGEGTLQMSGRNTYTGQTVLESGALSISSFNSHTKGKNTTSSSLGSPMDIEAGEIVIGEEGKEGEGALIYTGTGETTDRVMNLAGKKSTVTFDQSGTGLLKLTSTFVISGFGADKTIVLKGDTAGTGEIAGNLSNPHDRSGKATTAVTKSGTGTWTLSGTNTYSGATTVKQGTLSIASAKSLGDKTEVYVSEGAMLDLGFKGEVRVNKLYLDGKLMPAGTYRATNTSGYLKGSGVLVVQP